MPNELSCTYYDMMRNSYVIHSCPENVVKLLVIWGTWIWLPENVEWKNERDVLEINLSNI